MSTSEKLPTLPFATAPLWEQWLSEYHTKLRGVWIKVAKKTSGIVSVTHEEALDVALCYGWIDGLRNRCDDQYFLQKFTPRQPKSHWSMRNIANVARLMNEGRMQPPCLAQVEAAQQEGRWEAASELPTITPRSIASN
jgi:uncharacterized protein YdeI (YjbR/CyaY-like superfamily)